MQYIFNEKGRTTENKNKIKREMGETKSCRVKVILDVVVAVVEKKSAGCEGKTRE